MSIKANLRRLHDRDRQTDIQVTFLADGTSVPTVGTDATDVARHSYLTVEAVGDHTVRCEFAGDAWVEAGNGEGLLRIY